MARSIISDFFITFAFHNDFSQEVRLLVVKKVKVPVDQTTVNEVGRWIEAFYVCFKF